MTPLHHHYLTESRREFLKHTGAGIGALGLASVLNDRLFAAPAAGGQGDPLILGQPHFAPRAKNVIYIHLVGGPSHLELFDYKPELVKRSGEKCPDDMFKGKQLAFIREHPKLLGTRFNFYRHGQGGLELSEHLPHLGSVADELAIVKTVRTEQFNHAPAQLFLHTGFERFGRPGIGSWVSYGLGTGNRDLPGYVVMITGSVAGAGNSLCVGIQPNALQTAHHVGDHAGMGCLTRLPEYDHRVERDFRTPLRDRGAGQPCKRRRTRNRPTNLRCVVNGHRCAAPVFLRHRVSKDLQHIQRQTDIGRPLIVACQVDPAGQARGAPRHRGQRGHRRA